MSPFLTTGELDLEIAAGATGELAVDAVVSRPVGLDLTQIDRLPGNDGNFVRNGRSLWGRRERVRPAVRRKLIQHEAAVDVGLRLKDLRHERDPGVAVRDRFDPLVVERNAAAVGEAALDGRGTDRA